MLHLTQDTRILLALTPISFRKQIDGLVALCEQHLSEDPHSGQLFVFINKARTMIRVLCYEGNGYWLATKRLSRGRYGSWPECKEALSYPLTAAELTKILRSCIASRGKNNIMCSR